MVGMEGKENGEVDNTRLVEVRFVTKLPQSLEVPTRSMKLTRLGLSEIVNHLLLSMDSEFKHMPFDFVVTGEFIRMPLEQFLLTNGISTERVFEIEYVKAVVPHDDWVSAVNGSHPRLWKGSSLCSHVLEGHNALI